MTLKGKITSFLKKVMKGIRKAWNKLSDEAKVLVPIAISVTNALKEIVEDGSFSGELIETILAKIKIKGDVDEKALELIRKWVPEVLTKLIIVGSIADQTTTEAQLSAIIDEIKLYNSDQKELFWDGFAKKFLEYSSDGEISKDEVGYLVKWYYDNSELLENE
jgi:hypothetical protein